jgi:DNA-binding transcriptional MocR family regulator
MLKATLKKGEIVPLEPVPLDWKEGATLEVTKMDADDFDVNEWAKSMNELCADSSPEDEAIMDLAIEEHRKQAKEWMRREMGLAE